MGGGVSERQADAHADGLQEALAGVAKVSDIDNAKTELRAEISVLRAEMAALRVEMEAMREQMRGLRQTMVLGFAILGGVNVAVMSFLVVVVMQIL